MNEGTLFPASESTPGQKASRAAYAALETRLKEYNWFGDYESLRSKGLDWRKAMAVAWRASRGFNRQPATQTELASLMGLKSDRTIRKWFEDSPELEELVGVMQAAPLFSHRRDVIEALVTSASTPAAQNSADRRLFFQMTGDLEEKSQHRFVGSEEEPVRVQVSADLSKLETEELMRLQELLAKATPDEAAASAKSG